MTHQISPLGCALIALGVATVATTNVASANGGVYLESGGIVVVEIESAPPTPSWALSTQTPAHTGDGYFRWDGPNLFQSPGAGGLFVFDFEITTPGTYSFNLRNRHEHPNPTEENDVWDPPPWEPPMRMEISRIPR